MISDNESCTREEIQSACSIREELQGLSSSELDSILNILVLDNILVRKGNNFSFKRVYPQLQIPDNLQMPCDKCNLIEQCHSGGFISPETCQYFVDW